MPRIREIKVSPFNEVQDIGDDDRAIISRNFAEDIARAVEDDHPCSDTDTCDIARMLEIGAPISAAGMLYGATECAHVDAVIAAHYFNRTLPMVDGRPYDPRRDVYSSPDWPAWQAYHNRYGQPCEACGGVTYGDDYWTPEECGHCGASLAFTDEQVSEVVYGYVTAATWTDLERPCERCGGSAEIAPDELTEDEWGEVESDVRADLIARMIAQPCPDCENGGSAEGGSDPYEYGPEDLDAESRETITEMCADFLKGSRPDVLRYVETMGPITDHPQAAGGIQLGARECSALESLGHDLYLTSVGHGTGFWDRGLGELGERLTRDARNYGVSSVMMCTDGSIQIQ